MNLKYLIRLANHYKAVVTDDNSLPIFIFALLLEEHFRVYKEHPNVVSLPTFLMLESDDPHGHTPELTNLDDLYIHTTSGGRLSIQLEHVNQISALTALKRVTISERTPKRYRKKPCKSNSLPTDAKKLWALLFQEFDPKLLWEVGQKHINGRSVLGAAAINNFKCRYHLQARKK